MTSSTRASTPTRFCTAATLRPNPVQHINYLEKPRTACSQGRMSHNLTAVWMSLTLGSTFRTCHFFYKFSQYGAIGGTTAADMCRHMCAGAVQGVLGAQAGGPGRHAGRLPRADGGVLGHRPGRAALLPRHPAPAAQYARRRARGRCRAGRCCRGRPSCPLNATLAGEGAAAATRAAAAAEAGTSVL